MTFTEKLSSGPGKNFPRTTKIKLNGRIVTLYSVGYLAGSIQRTSRMIRKYEKGGLLPRPIIEAPSGLRWYLADEVREYGMILKAYGPRQGMRLDLNPALRDSLIERLHQAKGRIKQKLNKDITLIEAALANEPEVANMQHIARINRTLKRINEAKKSAHERKSKKHNHE